MFKGFFARRRISQRAEILADQPSPEDRQALITRVERLAAGQSMNPVLDPRRPPNSARRRPPRVVQLIPPKAWYLLCLVWSGRRFDSPLLGVIKWFRNPVGKS